MIGFLILRRYHILSSFITRHIFLPITLILWISSNSYFLWPWDLAIWGMPSFIKATLLCIVFLAISFCWLHFFFFRMLFIERIPASSSAVAVTSPSCYFSSSSPSLPSFVASASPEASTDIHRPWRVILGSLIFLCLASFFLATFLSWNALLLFRFTCSFDIHRQFTFVLVFLWLFFSILVSH